MPMIKLDDLNMYYEIHGEGIPLILISGYTCDHAFWSCMVNTMAEQFKVLIFDNRAIGRTTDSGTQFILETMAEDIIKLSDALGLTNPYIVGQSMGGAIAQTIAIKYPDQIKKLVILNSVMKFNAASLMALKSILKLRKLNVPLDVIIEASLPWIYSSDYLQITGNIETFKQIIIDNPYPQSAENQQRQFNALSQFDSREWAAKIKAPTMIIAAENDILALPAESRELAQQINNAFFKLIPGGHASPIEKPILLSEAVSSFLR